MKKNTLTTFVFFFHVKNLYNSSQNIQIYKCENCLSRFASVGILSNLNNYMKNKNLKPIKLLFKNDIKTFHTRSLLHRFTISENINWKKKIKLYTT